jgi:hypothetical protein
MVSAEKNKRVYVLPALHFSAYVLIFVVPLITPFRQLALLSPLLWIADFPISIGAFALAWKYPLLAHLWIAVVGTAWWYFLSRIIVGWISNRSAARQSPSLPR